LKFLNRVLDNGLQVVAECQDEAYTSAMGYFVNTGARDESADIAGVSHFLEHMMFKGTPKRSAEDVNRDFDRMGAHYNAFTSDEHTVYYAAILPEHQSATLELLTDIMRPSLRGEDFDTEKQVIIEEIRMYDDQPPFGADDKCKALYFGEHPLANSVLGTVDSVGALSVDAMRGYFDRRYVPNNMVLAASGRIDFDQLCLEAEKQTRDWRTVDAPRREARTNPISRSQAIHRESAAQQYILEMVPGPSSRDEDRYAAKLLCVILGDDQGSRLYWELIDPGLVDGVSLGHHDYDECGVFFTYMSCQPDLAVDNHQRIHRVYGEAEAEGVTEEELILSKSKVNSRLVISSEKPRHRLFSVGGNWIQRREYRSVRDDLEIVRRLTVDEVNAVLKKYPLTSATTVSIGPLPAN
jgi:predicted Zn-dependent peptidase